MKKSTDIILHWRGGKMDFRELFDIIPDGIVLVGTDGYIIQANKAQAIMYGYKSAEEMIGVYAPNLVASSVTELGERITAQGESAEILPVEYEIKRNDGTTFWVEITASPQKNEENEISGYLCITRDITRRKLAEKAVLESEQRLELAMQSANMAWWGMDVSTGIVTFDKRKSDMLGYPQDKFRHYTDFMALVHPEDYERVMEAMKSHIFGSAIRYACEYRVLTSSGKYIWFYDVGSVVKKDSDGAPLTVVGIVIDINERKKIEKELLHAKEKAEKSEKDLILLNQHLQEVRESERALISREIHDQLGQSLTALKIDINWLQRKTRSGSETKAKLNAMTELVTETIRDVQRISSELRPSILDDIGLAAAMEWYCEDFSNRTGLTVNMEFENVQFENMNNNLALYRVLQESLTNIIRHAKAKTVRVKLCSAREKIVLLIHDDGIGIPRDKIKSPLSFGLLGMYERIKYSGGRMNISKPAAGGTKILVEIPLENTQL